MTKRKAPSKTAAQKRADEVLGDEVGPMSHVGETLPPGERRGNRAMLELTEAYQAVFSANATRAQAEKVLVNLASYSGFFMVSERGTSGDLLREQEGMRMVYGHIHNFLNLTGDEMRRLHEAARMEAMVNNSEGTL